MFNYVQFFKVLNFFNILECSIKRAAICWLISMNHTQVMFVCKIASRYDSTGAGAVTSVATYEQYAFVYTRLVCFILKDEALGISCVL